MKAWADFHPYVLPDVPGCPEPMLDQALRETARDFCTRTKAWAEWMDPLTASSARALYEFEPDAGTEVVAALAATVGEDGYAVIGAQALPAAWQDGKQGCVKDKTLIHVSSKEFILYPAPSAGQRITLQLALRPTMAGTGVGDVIFDEFAEAIAAGAKAKLMARPRKEWTDLQSAAMYGMEFERRVTLAANKDWHQSAQQRVSKAAL